MKKGIALLLFITALTVGWYYQSFSTVSPIIEVINENEQSRILEKLHESIPKKETVKDLNNFSLSTEQLLKNYSPKQLQTVMEQEVRILAECLEKDFCGMRVNEEKGYFDESEVGGAKNLKRQLHHLKTMIDSKSVLAASVDLPFEALFALPNKEIKVLAAEILLQKDSSSVQLESLIKQESLFTEESRGQFYKLLFKYSVPNSILHSTIVTNLLHVIQTEDSYLVITLLEASADFNLAEGEFFEVVKESCAFKSKPNEKHNWKMVTLALREAISKNRYSLAVDKICR